MLACGISALYVSDSRHGPGGHRCRLGRDLCGSGERCEPQGKRDWRLALGLRAGGVTIPSHQRIKVSWITR